MTITEKNFLFHLGSIRKRAFAFLQKEMKAAGVTDLPPAHGDVLFTLWQRGSLSLKEVCELSFRDKSTVSLIVNDAEKKGYVVKERDAQDGRGVKIRLTPRAEAKAVHMIKISTHLREKFFTGMSEEEISIFFMLLNKISRNV